MCFHSLHRLQKASGRHASSKASTSYRRPKSRTPLLQRRPKVASPRTAATTEEESSFSFWKRARTLAPSSHLISAGMCIPLFSASSSSRSFRSLPSLTPPMYQVSEMPWILIHLHFCWGTKSATQLFASQTTLSTISRCLRRSCSVEVGVVMPKSRWESVHRILSTLTSLMPSR